MASLAFATPGDSSTPVVGMRCGQCKILKVLSMDPATSAFPPSCAIYRRGSCRECNQIRYKDRYDQNPLHRKLESARVRYKTSGSLKVADVQDVYHQAGVDWTNAEHLRKTFLAKQDETLPFGRQNVKLKWRRGGDPFLSEGPSVVSCNA